MGFFWRNIGAGRESPNSCSWTRTYKHRIEKHHSITVWNDGRAPYLAISSYNSSHTILLYNNDFITLLIECLFSPVITDIYGPKIYPCVAWASSQVWEVLNIMSLSPVTVEMSDCVMWIRWGHNLWLVQALLTIQVSIFKSKLRLRSSMLEGIYWLAWFHPVSVSGTADVLYHSSLWTSTLSFDLLWAVTVLFWETTSGYWLQACEEL